MHQQRSSCAASEHLGLVNSLQQKLIDKIEYNFIAMDKQEAIQHKKRIRRERRQERNRVETGEQKVERLRKIRERQRQKLVI